MNKKVLAAVLALGLITSAGYFGSTYVLADDTNPMHSTIVSKIAERFNLNESDVEAVFDAVRDEKQDEMKKTREEKLSQAVADGVITEEQKTLLLTKMEEHQGERQTKADEMKKWFSDNGIDQTKLSTYLRPNFKGMGRHRSV